MLLKCTQSNQKNSKPGFQLLLNPGFGFGKMAGFPWVPFFKIWVSIPNTVYMCELFDVVTVVMWLRKSC